MTNVKKPAQGGEVDTTGIIGLKWPEFWDDPAVRRSAAKRSVLAGVANSSADITVSALNGGVRMSRETANAPFKAWVRFGDTPEESLLGGQAYRADAYVLTIPDGCVYDEHGAIYRIVVDEGSKIEIRENFTLKSSSGSAWCKRAAIIPIRWASDRSALRDAVFLYRMHSDPPGIVRLALASETTCRVFSDGRIEIGTNPSWKRMFSTEDWTDPTTGRSGFRWSLNLYGVAATMQTFCWLFAFSFEGDIPAQLSDVGFHWAEDTVFEPLFSGIPMTGVSFIVPHMEPSAVAGLGDGEHHASTFSPSKPGKIGDQIGAIRIVANCTVNRAHGVRANIVRIGDNYDVAVDVGSVSPLYGNIPVISTASEDPVTGRLDPRYRGILRKTLSSDHVTDSGILSLALVGKLTVHPDDLCTPVYDVDLYSEAEIRVAIDTCNLDVWDPTPGSGSVLIPILSFVKTGTTIDFDALRAEAGLPAPGSRTAIAMLDSHDSGTDANMWKPVECLFTRAGGKLRPGWEKDSVFYSSSMTASVQEMGARASAFLEELARKMTANETTNVIIRAHGISNDSSGGSSLYGGAITGASLAAVIQGVANADPSRTFRVFIMLDACYAAGFFPPGLVIPQNAHVLVLAASLSGSSSLFFPTREYQSPSKFDITCRFLGSFFRHQRPFTPSGAVTSIQTTFFSGISKALSYAGHPTYAALCELVRQYAESTTTLVDAGTFEMQRLFSKQGVLYMTTVTTALGGWNKTDFRRPAFT